MTSTPDTQFSLDLDTGRTGPHTSVCDPAAGKGPRIVTVLVSSAIQAQGPVVWQHGARACVETSPGIRVTGLMASAI